MKASVLDLRRRMKDILDSLSRNEPVTLLRRGKVVGTIQPPGASPDRPAGAGTPATPARASSHPAFGLWKDRADLRDIAAVVARLRKERFNAH
jgi:antitoxin (DNA-binding transcriptional repressor) of toxin-antitoxin stability system